MNAAKLRELLHRDGWLLTALGVCVGVCLLLSGMQGAEENQQEHFSRILSAIEGAGRVELAVSYDAQSVPCGALVLAQGAASPGVRIRLIQAVATLLGVDPSAVAVYPLQGGPQ